jgi:hypothetical protein
MDSEAPPPDNNGEAHTQAVVPPANANADVTLDAQALILPVSHEPTLVPGPSDEPPLDPVLSAALQQSVLNFVIDTVSSIFSEDEDTPPEVQELIDRRIDAQIRRFHRRQQAATTPASDRKKRANPGTPLTETPEPKKAASTAPFATPTLSTPHISTKLFPPLRLDSTPRTEPHAAVIPRVEQPMPQPKTATPSALDLLLSKHVPWPPQQATQQPAPQPQQAPTRALFVVLNKTNVQGPELKAIAKSLYELGLIGCVQKLAPATDKFVYSACSRFRRSIIRIPLLPSAPALSICKFINSSEGIFTSDILECPDPAPNMVTYASSPSPLGITPDELLSEVRDFYRGIDEGEARRITAKIVQYRLYAHGTHIQVRRFFVSLPASLAITLPRVSNTTLYLSHIPSGIRHSVMLLAIPIRLFSTCPELTTVPFKLLRKVAGLEGIIGAVPLLHPVGGTPAELGWRDNCGGIVAFFNNPEQAALSEFANLVLDTGDGSPTQIRAEQVSDRVTEWLKLTD